MSEHSQPPKTVIFLWILPLVFSITRHLLLSTEPDVWSCQKSGKVITLFLPHNEPIMYTQNCTYLCCNSFPFQPNMSWMCCSVRLMPPTVTSDAFQPLCFPDFPPITEHVSSKLPSPLNCLTSTIYTSCYLARVLLPSNLLYPPSPYL